MAQTYKRHLAKTVTWRLLGTLDTVLLSWFITGKPLQGLSIGVSELLTKPILYFLHERVWFKIRRGKTKSGDDSKKRHLAKTITWRIIGTLDTMVLAGWITNDVETGLTIGLVEVVTKMILYYFHERLWYRSDFGIEEIRRERNEQ